MLAKTRIASLLDEREGTLRVDRAVYHDPAIFEEEIVRLFEGGWVFVAHDSQIRNPGDYFATRLGRQPVFVMRQKGGGIGAFLNVCTHRGATLLPLEQGRASVITCRFHGWVFGQDGRCIKIKNEETGAYGHGDLKSRAALQPVARVEAYRGFIFASLEPDVRPLADWLGPAARWIDLMVDQSPEGLEVVRGASTYVFRGNWKLQAENGVDGYHVSTVHRNFATTVANRESKRVVQGMAQTEAGRITGQVRSGAYDFGHGHLGIWAERTNPQAHPLWSQRERLEREYSPERVDWMLKRGRNLFLFPNMFLMDNPSTQIRWLHPVAPDLCEVTVRCVAPVGEPPAIRAARLRKFEDFYLTTGMSTSDDLAALEATHAGGLARAQRWNDFNRGVLAVRRGAEDTDGAAIGLEPPAMNPNWDHEVLYHGFYRHWRAAMQGAA